MCNVILGNREKLNEYACARCIRVGVRTKHMEVHSIKRVAAGAHLPVQMSAREMRLEFELTDLNPSIWAGYTGVYRGIQCTGFIWIVYPPKRGMTITDVDESLARL